MGLHLLVQRRRAGAFRSNSIAAFAYPRSQPSGSIEFTGGGSGTFDVPRYDVRFRRSTICPSRTRASDRSPGRWRSAGTRSRGEIDAASPRLAVTGTGRIALTPDADARADVPLPRQLARSVRPALRADAVAVHDGRGQRLDPGGRRARRRRSPAGRCHGRQLGDAAVRLRGPERRARPLALDQHVVRVEDLQLVGDDTRLTRRRHDRACTTRRSRCGPSGDANLGILQGFFRDVRGSGRAELAAAIDGPLYEPVFSGSATIADGRIRHFSLPNSLDAINGTIRFDSRGVRLDDLAATLGGGRVQFGGRIGFDGYLPGELNVSARGEGMQLRVSRRRPLDGRRRPDGPRQLQGAGRRRRGDGAGARSGTAASIRRAALFDFGGGGRAPTGPARRRPPIPLRFDLEVHVPSTLRIENNLARLVASADLQLRGTYDRPLLFGRAEVDRGEVTFEGRRYLVTRGAHRVHQPDAHRAVLRRRGRDARARAGPDLPRHRPRRRHDGPPAARARVRSAAAGGRRAGAAVQRRAPRSGPGTSSCARCRTPNEREPDILATRARRSSLASPISSEVGRVVEQTFGVDTFQLTPSLIDPVQPVGDEPREPVGPGHHRQAHLGPRVPDLLAEPRARRSTTRSCCSSTTRATGCRGFCRATRTRATPSRSA